jgi:hypothetical protein
MPKNFFENLVLSLHIISIKSEFCEKTLHLPPDIYSKEFKSEKQVHDNGKAITDRSDNTDR